MKRPRMKRLLLLLLTYAVGGAIINVAVAWGFAIWEPYRSDPTNVTDQASQMFATYGFPIRAGAEVLAVRGRGCGLTLTTASIEGDETSEILMLTESGWPARSIYGVLRSVSHMGMESTVSIHSGVGLSPKLRSRPALMHPLTPILPLRPIWPGFAINTIFYTAILWLLFAAPGFVRRRIRARRGQCPACAYPVGASDVCTECGCTLPSPSR